MLYLVQIQISSSGGGPPVKSVGRKYKRAVPYERIAYLIAKEHDSGHNDMKDESPSGIWGRIAVNLNWLNTNAKRKYLQKIVWKNNRGGVRDIVVRKHLYLIIKCIYNGSLFKCTIMY